MSKELMLGLWQMMKGSGERKKLCYKYVRREK
jgi:hypothetical protein